jgi:hypothetical protein
MFYLHPRSPRPSEPTDTETDRTHPFLLSILQHYPLTSSTRMYAQALVLFNVLGNPPFIRHNPSTQLHHSLPHLIPHIPRSNPRSANPHSLRFTASHRLSLQHFIRSKIDAISAELDLQLESRIRHSRRRGDYLVVSQLQSSEELYCYLTATRSGVGRSTGNVLYA